MIALVDCNSFFCSVEKAFHAGLNGKPVCVLSSNDGCIVALTPEAKAIGLHRGDPIFKMREIVEHNDVRIFSGNIMLYAAMSKRITSILRQSVAKVENYSIDESFCYLDGYEKHFNLNSYMRDVAERVKLWTDIPVSIGVAPTKTLAKIGSKFAKRYKGYHDVCLIDTDEKRRKALELFDLADVWGIGRQTFAKLKYHGIDTPLQFAEKSESWVRSHLTKPGIQTWMELNGHPCIQTEECLRRKTICTSRSFGEMVSDFDSLRSSIATFAASCANKLRAQSSVATTVSAFICSNRFREDLDQYGNFASVRLAVPTSDTTLITQAAVRALESIFIPGIRYKKSGVFISDITPAFPMQLNLFDPIHNRKERDELMRSIDRLNHRHGLKTVHLAAEGEETEPWKVKCDHQSPNYLTDLDEILTVKA